jgi:hypothetical protein
VALQALQGGAAAWRHGGAVGLVVRPAGLLDRTDLGLGWLLGGGDAGDGKQKNGK